MQTFLPYPSFQQTARCLDSKRLGNQCYRETLTLIRGGWPHHPAARMWHGHSHALARYGLALAAELCSRGRAVGDRWFSYYTNTLALLDDTGPPPWLGNEEFHASHRSALLRKDPEWYSQFGWLEPPNLPYIWPSAQLHSNQTESKS